MRIELRTVDELLKYLKMDLSDISEVLTIIFSLDFKWDPDTLFPSIPCHTDAGLIYPLEGYTCVRVAVRLIDRESICDNAALRIYPVRKTRLL